MAGLKLAKYLDIYLAHHKVIVLASLYSHDITLPTILIGCSDAAIAVLAIIALNNIGMYVQ
jgi:hypothetical protein